MTVFDLVLKLLENIPRLDYCGEPVNIYINY